MRTLSMRVEASTVVGRRGLIINLSRTRVRCTISSDFGPFLIIAFLEYITF